MKSKWLTVLAIAASFLLTPGPVLAHHSPASYDNTKTVTVQGTVTDFQFVNPHVLIYINAADDGGNVQKWQGELTSPNHLVRVGWNREIIKPGDQITLTGYRSKNGANSLRLMKVFFNGHDLRTGGD